MNQGALFHFALEASAYVVAAVMYRFTSLRRSIDSVPFPQNGFQKLAIVAAAVFGAAMGARLLYLLDYWHALQVQPVEVWFSGKTIVGGLLGGLVAVEIAKKLVDWPQSTGDRFVPSLLIGMIIGRVGCQFAGLEDLTYGGATSLPWGWNYGDGVPRHPVAIYEIVGLLTIGVVLIVFRRRLIAPGDRFKLFLTSYLGLRLGLDCLKPPFTTPAAHMLAPTSYAGLSAIQWACVAGLIYYLWSIKLKASASRTK
ncbi:MAG: prolipoprotein diacylglyceryl transferase family protein [Steroidobacter sp.]